MQRGVPLSHSTFRSCARIQCVRGMTKGGDLAKMTYLELIRANLRREEGQTMAEYGVILAVITVLIIGALLALSSGIRNNINSVVGVL